MKPSLVLLAPFPPVLLALQLAAQPLPDLALEQVVPAGSITDPTSITHAGDERLFVTAQDGQIYIVENGEVQAVPFLDLSNLVLSGGERGLFSVAFHPDYATNGFFFVNYSNTAGDSVIARYSVSAGDPDRADPQSARVLLTIAQDFGNHNGGQLQFGPHDGYLYTAMGDGGSGNDPNCRAQSYLGNNRTLLGKMLRLDVDQNVNTPPYYGIPADNPFGGVGEPQAEVWALGLRNPWRFSFDRLTGDLFIADVGQNQWEEINFQPAQSSGGENYGWHPMEGDHCTGNPTGNCSPTPPSCDSNQLSDPILEYSHASGCSVTGGYLYRGGRIPSLRGTYLYADYCSARIWGARRDPDGSWSTQELDISRVTDGVRTFGEDASGELYFATGNRLYRITGPGGPLVSDFGDGPVPTLFRDGAWTSFPP